MLLLLLLLIGFVWCFNSNVIKQVKTVADYYAGKQVDVFAIGKKGNDVLSKTNNVTEIKCFLTN